MKLLRTLLAIGCLCAVCVYADAPKGTVPRAAADSYPAHILHDGVGIGAVLLTADQARKAFASDLERCCLVVEVAFYPQKDAPMNISMDDFVLRLSGTDIATKPSTAEVLAAKLQKKAASSSGGKDVVVSPTAGVGYGTGSNNAGGPQRGGVFTSGGVGVGIGGSQPPAPGSTDRDRRTMELELSEKGLPEGAASAPISGYLYFVLSSSKDKKATHQLEYMLSGQKVTLQLP